MSRKENGPTVSGEAASLDVSAGVQSANGSQRTGDPSAENASDPFAAPYEPDPDPFKASHPDDEDDDPGDLFEKAARNADPERRWEILEDWADNPVALAAARAEYEAYGAASMTEERLQAIVGVLVPAVEWTTLPADHPYNECRDELERRRLQAQAERDEAAAKAKAEREKAERKARNAKATAQEPKGKAAAPVSGDLTADEEAAFWSSSPVLERIRQFAWARRTASWAVLGAVLCEVVARVPPHVVLPPITGGNASLNLFVALVGTSGDGKGAATAAARDLTRHLQPVPRAAVGSGEGITKTFGERGKKPMDPTVMLTDRVVASVAEIDTLTALGKRQASTLLPQLRKVWVGEDLSYGYADRTKAPVVPDHSYRMALTVGVQPLKADGLLEDADGGTPQRFVWLHTLDRSMPARRPDEPEPLALGHIERRWPMDPFVLSAVAGTSGSADEDEAGEQATTDGRRILKSPTTFEVLKVAPEVWEAVDANRVAKHHGAATDTSLDGHAALARLKVAAALSLLLGGQGDVTGELWELSGVVIRKSTATRTAVERALSSAAAKAHEAAAQRNAAAEVRKVEAVEGRKLQQTRRRLHTILDKPENRTGGLPLGKLKVEAGSAYRDNLQEVLDYLLEVGELEEVPGGKAPRYRLAGRSS